MTSETVTVARCCQQYAQPVSPAVSCGNDLYKTNSPSASVATIVRNHSHTCACAAFISCGYYSRVVFISFKSFGLCGYYLRAASNRKNTVLAINQPLNQRVWPFTPAVVMRICFGSKVNCRYLITPLSAKTSSQLCTQFCLVPHFYLGHEQTWNTGTIDENYIYLKKGRLRHYMELHTVQETGQN